jgi:alpha-acetolactate decarboxylase
MLEHSYFSDFDDNDVVAFDELTLHKAKKLKQVMEAMQRDQIESNINDYLRSQNICSRKYGSWTGIGSECEVLKLGAKEWQKGRIKVRISVEFYPDEPETINEPPSPLDDIRQSMS